MVFGRRDARLDSASSLCEEDLSESRVQDLHDRFSVEVPVQHPFVRVPVQGASKKSQQEICVRDLNVR